MKHLAKKNNSIKTLLLAFSLSASLFAQANYTLLDKSEDGNQVVLPSYPNTSSVSDKQTGTLIYDNSTNQIKTYDSAGNWVAMSATGGNVITSNAATDHIERAYVTGSSCAVSNSSGGSWLTYVSGHSTGRCPLVMSGFSSTPVCTITPMDNRAFGITSISATALTSQITNDSGTLIDTDFMIICMGPH